MINLTLFYVLLILSIAVGFTAGVLLTAIPGLSAAFTMALLFPAVMLTDRSTGISLLTAAYVGSMFGEVVKARQGHPDELQHKLFQSIGGTAAALLLSCIIVPVLSSFLTGFRLFFSPVEYFAWAVLAAAIGMTWSSAPAVKGILTGIGGMIFYLLYRALFYQNSGAVFGDFLLPAGLALLSLLTAGYAVWQLILQPDANIPGNGADEIVPRPKRRLLLPDKLAGPGKVLAADMLFLFGIPLNTALFFLFLALNVPAPWRPPSLLADITRHLGGILSAGIISCLLLLITTFIKAEHISCLAQKTKTVVLPFVLLLCAGGLYIMHGGIRDILPALLIGGIIAVLMKYRLPVTAFLFCFVICETLTVTLEQILFLFGPSVILRQPLAVLPLFLALIVIVAGIFWDRAGTDLHN